MEFPNELIPFVVGLVFAPPVLMMATRAARTEGVRFALRVAASMLIGAAMSFLAGELALDPPEAISAIVIDTSLVYLGSRVAYWLLWKRIEERWIQPALNASPAVRN